MGGESFEIRKEPRALFFAQIDSEEAYDKDEEVEINAQSIGEPAIYNWYDADGNLLYEGADFNTSVEVGKHYKLEVIALADGYKDYADVDLEYKPNRITTLSPNPTTGQTDVAYKINQGDAAYLAVTSVEHPNITDNYVLNMETDTITVNMTGKPTGSYVVTLIVDGEIADAKNLIKN